MALERNLALAGIGALALLSSCCDDEEDLCESDQVATRADPSVDFTLYTTFSIAPDEALPDVPPDVATNLAVATAAAVQELLALGLTQLPPDSDPPADLALFNIAASSEETGTTWVCTPGYWWTGWGYVWDPCAWMVEVPVNYTQGTLAVGLVDPDLSAVVFGGVLQGVLECGNTSARVQAGVARIFDQYPTAP